MAGYGRLEDIAVTLAGDPVRQALLRRGFAPEYVTLAWNVIGIVVLAIAAISARSVALAGFGLDSLIETGASTVVIWVLSGTGEQRQRRRLRLIGYAFAALAATCWRSPPWCWPPGTTRGTRCPGSSGPR
jgi:hypothetical protein